MKKYVLLFALGLMVFGYSCKESDPELITPPQKPQYSLTDFERSEACSTCHPQYYNEWSGSMHRFSTSDPIWRLANNSLQASMNGGLGKTCFQCHAPMGFLTDNTKPSFEFSELNEQVREGIGCDFCHILRAPFKTTDQHIEYTIHPGPIKYGTLENPSPAGAHQNGYDATYDRSEVCRQCHDLVVNHIPLEVTFTEWQNSAWGAMSVECQKCHMQTYSGKAATTGPVRNNLHRHDFIGVDVAVGDFPNKAEQRAGIDSLLKQSATLTVNAPSTSALVESVHVAVTVYNDKTGHNLPTSVFFNRQMWIEVTAWKGSDTVYRSGNLDDNGDLMDANSALHPNEDHDLTIFNGAMYKNGQPSNVVELDSLVNLTIPPFASRIAHYTFKPTGTGTWHVKTRLLYRSLGPYLYRSFNVANYISEVPIFEMNTDEKTIIVH